MQDKSTTQTLKPKKIKRKKCACGEFQIRTCPASTPLRRLISLTQGKFAIVDAENYEWLDRLPIATDGKFRVRECTIVEEKDLIEIGLQEVAKVKQGSKRQ